MKLPSLSFLKQKQVIQKEYFLALLIRSHKIGAILFEEVNKSLSILTTTDEKSEKPIQELTADELVDLSDRVISEVEKVLPDGKTVEKTIFAVPYSWVETEISGGKIKKDYLLKLKKVCDNLALTPIGFIISIEAIIAFQQKKIGAPLTAIFVEASENLVSVYLVKSGNLIQALCDNITENISTTVEGLLAQNDKLEILPSKIYLLASLEQEKIAQEFLKHKWSEDLAFLHIPQVETLASEFENEATVNGVATQMGFEVLTPENKEEKEKDDEIENTNFDFVKEQDIADLLNEKELEEASRAIPHMKHVEEKHEDHQKPDDTDYTQKHTTHKKEENDDDENDIYEEEGKKSPLNFLTHMKMPRFVMPKISLPHNNFGVFTLVIALFLIGIGLYFYYNTYLVANINVTPIQKAFQKDIDVTFSKGSTSATDRTIAIKSIPQDVDGQSSAAATGKKDTGDRAHGDVTLYNKSANSITLTKGSAIVGNSLKFDLTGDVTIASTSAFATSFSTAKGGILAENFGQEYNLPSSTNFTVAGFASSDIIAKNESAFSGGTKKSVTAITKKDLDTLASSLLDSLKTKAATQASNGLDSTSSLISIPLTGDFTQKKFDKKEGDEANKVTLTGKATFTFGVYKKEDIETIIKSIAKNSIPKEFHYLANKSQINIKQVTVDKNGNALGTLSTNAVFEPDFKIDDLKNIAGQSVSSIQKRVLANPNVEHVTITFTHKLPLLPNLLPINPQNIKIIIQRN